MYVGIDEDGMIIARYEDENAQEVLKVFQDAVIIKVPDEIGEIGRGIYKYKVVQGNFVLRQDLDAWEKDQKIAIVNSYRYRRNELLKETDWTQTADCPLEAHVKEQYTSYRKFLRDFPQTYDPKIDENGKELDKFTLPESLEDFIMSSAQST